MVGEFKKLVQLTKYRKPPHALRFVNSPAARCRGPPFPANTRQNRSHPLALNNAYKGKEQRRLANAGAVVIGPGIETGVAAKVAGFAEKSKYIISVIRPALGISAGAPARAGLHFGGDAAPTVAFTKLVPPARFVNFDS